MSLNKLILTKEELPILHDHCFQIPIHPKLLDSVIHIREEIAKEVFPKVAEEWRNDLIEYLPLEKDQQKREWYEQVFLKKHDDVVKRNNSQFFGIWEDEIQLADNGLVVGFSISRNVGGSLYFSKSTDNCYAIIPGRMIKFSPEKTEKFATEKNGKYSKAFVYSSHNIDYYPGALFLRNWVIEYMNEVFEEIKLD
jgi:hypothetical protein